LGSVSLDVDEVFNVGVLTNDWLEIDPLQGDTQVFVISFWARLATSDSGYIWFLELDIGPFLTFYTYKVNQMTTSLISGFIQSFFIILKLDINSSIQQHNIYSDIINWEYRYRWNELSSLSFFSRVIPVRNEHLKRDLSIE